VAGVRVRGLYLAPCHAARLLVRSMGIPQVKPVNRTIFGIDEVDAPVTGSGLVEYDFGLPPEPTANVTDREGSDPHGAGQVLLS
jgi:hypothetical protein